MRFIFLGKDVENQEERKAEKHLLAIQKRNNFDKWLDDDTVIINNVGT